MLLEPPVDPKLSPVRAGFFWKFLRGLKRFFLVFLFLGWGFSIVYSNIRFSERTKLWAWALADTAPPPAPPPPAPPSPASSSPARVPKPTTRFLDGPASLKDLSAHQRYQLEVFEYWRGRLSRVMSTHLRWWMYGKQSTHTYEVRVYGRYGQGQESLYRDLYLPYSLRRYFLTYRNVPVGVFYPPESVTRLSLSGLVTSELVPDLPLPLLSLHPDVPYPVWDPFRAKYTDNLMSKPPAQRAYAWGFARRYPTYEGLPLEAVYLDIWRQDILPRSEALRTGALLAPEVYRVRLFELRIPRGFL